MDHRGRRGPRPAPPGRRRQEPPRPRRQEARLPPPHRPGRQARRPRAFRKAHGLCRLSLASPADLERLLGLYPGAVTPLGLLNDAAHRVRLYLDEHLVKGPEDGLLGVHPNDNTATVYLRAADLVDLLRADGAAVEVVPF
ncbi:YbaK/EbsC family protein [Actinomyces radicidentis]|uniref:YbaK/EbsC family protein n=1 Tax=Actinomyces radicidentis TaxID=111015 RepID=UPI001B80D77D|nr:YbaK/EbsC family protein [Actinomyces radicidentis]